jgi:hypothetical protein
VNGSSSRLRRRGLGLATATTSATFFPHREHRIRFPTASSVGERFAQLKPTPEFVRIAPHQHVMRTRKWRAPSNARPSVIQIFAANLSRSGSGLAALGYDKGYLAQRGAVLFV